MAAERLESRSGTADHGSLVRRCAGPVVLVNQRPIVVNPIVIKAVGDPELLERAVQEIADRFALLGKRLEVRRTERVSLAAVGFE